MARRMARRLYFFMSIPSMRTGREREMKRLCEDEVAPGYRRLFPPPRLAGDMEGRDDGRKPGGWKTMPYIIGIIFLSLIFL